MNFFPSSLASLVIPMTTLHAKSQILLLRKIGSSLSTWRGKKKKNQPSSTGKLLQKNHGIILTEFGIVEENYAFYWGELSLSMDCFSMVMMPLKTAVATTTSVTVNAITPSKSGSPAVNLLLPSSPPTSLNTLRVYLPNGGFNVVKLWRTNTREGEFCGLEDNLCFFSIKQSIDQQHLINQTQSINQLDWLINQPINRDAPPVCNCAWTMLVCVWDEMHWIKQFLRGGSVETCTIDLLISGG